MADARRWADASGRIRWQPVQADGAALWYERGFGNIWSNLNYTNSTRVPILYRSRRFAIWRARLQDSHDARTTWHPTDEREDDEVHDDDRP